MGKRVRASDLSSNQVVDEILDIVDRNSARIEELRTNLAELQKMLDGPVTDETTPPVAPNPKEATTTSAPRALSGIASKPRRRRRRRLV